MAYDPTVLTKAQKAYDDALQKATAQRDAVLQNVSNQQSALINPYQTLSNMYLARTGAIEAQTKQADLERIQREQNAQRTLESTNRGVYTTYKNAINPYGRIASQNNFSSGVSDYYKNAAYGTMLQGIGTNQFNYNDAINNSNSLWQNYLAEKAGNEADALNDYNSAVLAQQKYDKEQDDLEKERQRAIEEFNLNLKLQQDKLDQAKAQDEEDKRRWEIEQALEKEKWEWQKAQAGNSGSSGSGSGGSSRSSDKENPYDFGPDDDNKFVNDNYTTLGAMDTSRDQAKVHAKNPKSSKETDSDANLIVKTWHVTLPNGRKVKYTRYKDGHTTSAYV